jgi:hypothetical protein
MGHGPARRPATLLGIDTNHRPSEAMIRRQIRRQLPALDADVLAARFHP